MGTPCGSARTTPSRMGRFSPWRWRCTCRSAPFGAGRLCASRHQVEGPSPPLSESSDLVETTARPKGSVGTPAAKEPSRSPSPKRRSRAGPGVTKPRRRAADRARRSRLDARRPRRLEDERRGCQRRMRHGGRAGPERKRGGHGAPRRSIGDKRWGSNATCRFGAEEPRRQHPSAAASAPCCATSIWRDFSVPRDRPVRVSIECDRSSQLRDRAACRGSELKCSRARRTRSSPGSAGSEAPGSTAVSERKPRRSRRSHLRLPAPKLLCRAAGTFWSREKFRAHREMKGDEIASCTDTHDAF